MARRGFFDRPLWRIILPIILVSFAAHGIAMLVVLGASGASGAYTVVYVFEVVAALGAAGYIFLGYPKRDEHAER